MSQIQEQVHNKFKIFTGALQPDGSIGPLADEISRYVSESKIAPKSIGVEYLESARRLIVSLGYRDDEAGYPVTLHSVSLGSVDTSGADLNALERKMAEASAGLPNIICHELYITDKQEMLMIFMTHKI
jgi:hypothetical protein